MESGYYWYLPAEEDLNALEGGPQVVQVVGGVVYACGDAIGVRLEEALGRFHGPLRCPWMVVPLVG